MVAKLFDVGYRLGQLRRDIAKHAPAANRGRLTNGVLSGAAQLGKKTGQVDQLATGHKLHQSGRHQRLSGLPVTVDVGLGDHGHLAGGIFEHQAVVRVFRKNAEMRLSVVGQDMRRDISLLDFLAGRK